MTAGQIGPCTPFFIISDIEASLAHYVGRLGFRCSIKTPERGAFFAIVARGTAQIMLKVIGDEAPPLPNHRRHRWARWDAYIHAEQPDALAREFEGSGLGFHEPLQTTDDGLRGFSVADPDGYVCFFGRPAG